MGPPPLERRQRDVVELGHAGPVAGLLHQLGRGLGEVHLEPRAAIEPRQSSGCGDATIWLIAHHPAHHRSVLLLNMGLVILAIGRERVNATCIDSHHSSIVLFMKTLSLSSRHSTLGAKKQAPSE